MTIKYKYVKAGHEFDGELPPLPNLTGHHEVVKAVLSEIATREGERIVVAMMSTYVEGQQVGIDHFDPAGVKPSEQRTIECIQISDDGMSWNNVALVKP